MGKVPGNLVARWASNAGFRDTDQNDWLVIAVAIAAAGSGWNTAAHYVTSREDSRGLWQINVRAHPWGRNIDLYNGAINAQAAWRVYQEAGASFRPWSEYLHGTYRQYLPAAYAAVGKIAPDLPPPGSPVTPGQSDWDWHPHLKAAGAHLGSAGRTLDSVGRIIKHITGG